MRRIERIARIAFLLVVVGAAAWVLVRNWSDVVHAFGKVTPGAVLGATALGVLGSWALVPCWQNLLAGLGSVMRLRDAQRIVLISQLGKYVPGGVMIIVAQASLAKDLKVPRSRSATAGVLAMVLGAVVGAVVGGGLLGVSGQQVLGRYAWALLLAVPLLALLHPALLAQLTRLAGRLTGRQVNVQRLPARRLAVAALIQLGSMLAYGTHFWLLASSVTEGYPSPVLLIGLFAFAWVAGLVVVIAPAGAGVREAILVLGLAPLMDSGTALLVALLSRVITIVVDFGLAGLAAVIGRWTARGVDAPAGP